MADANFVELILTCGSWQEAQKIADVLLEKHLVACVEFMDVKSKSWWEGKLEETEEIKLIMQCVAENFERSLKHVPDDLKGDDFVKGVQGVVKQFEKTLNDMDVERIKTVGKHFDPKLHEAVSMEEGEGTKEIVSEELQAGYRLGDDIIRHAMVRVKAE